MPDNLIEAYIQNTEFGKALIAIKNFNVLCAIIFSESNKALLEEAANMFPEHKIVCSNDSSIVRSILDHRINNHRPNYMLPLSIDFSGFGTPFQQRVWLELLTIPPGKTVSYGEIAKRIGKPKAVRGVASAIANNPISILIPCHRVVPKVGGVGKYRWGTRMKQRLLQREYV